MPKDRKGEVWHYESYDGPDNPFKVGLTETPTSTCNHCSTVVILNPDRTRERGWCWNCNTYICDACNGVKMVVGCHPIEQTMELIIANPNANLMLHRGWNKEALGDEVALAEASKPYQGFTLGA